MTTPNDATNGPRGAAEQNSQAANGQPRLNQTASNSLHGDPAQRHETQPTATSEQLREQAAAGARQAAEMGKAQLDQHKAATADQLETLADGARAAADELSQHDQQQMSHYLQELAGGITRFASSLRDRNADDLVHEATQLARRNPGLFIAGSIAVGFGLSRFMRASERPRDATQPLRRGTATPAATGLTGSGDFAAPPLTEDEFTRSGLQYGQQPVGSFGTTPVNGNGNGRYPAGFSTESGQATNGQSRTGGPLS